MRQRELSLLLRGEGDGRERPDTVACVCCVGERRETQGRKEGDWCAFVACVFVMFHVRTKALYFGFCGSLSENIIFLFEKKASE